MSEWNEVLKEYCEVKLDEDQVRFWLTELKEQFRDLTGSEIIGAIREGTRQQDKYAKKPTLATMRAWIAMYRGKGKGSTMPKQNEVDIEFCRAVFQRMLRAPNHVEAWNMLCQPGRYANAGRETTVAECSFLEDMAIQHIEGFQRPSLAELTGGEISVDEAVQDLLKGVQSDETHPA